MYPMQDDRDHVERGSRETATRMVMDAQGNEWIVREVDTPQPWAHGDRCLIFSSPAIVRRVWRYPEGWARLSSPELFALLGDTSPP
jgi:hypothetical protein